MGFDNSTERILFPCPPDPSPSLHPARPGRSLALQADSHQAQPRNRLAFWPALCLRSQDRDIVRCSIQQRLLLAVGISDLQQHVRLLEQPPSELSSTRPQPIAQPTTMLRHGIGSLSRSAAALLGQAASKQSQSRLLFPASAAGARASMGTVTYSPPVVKIGKPAPTFKAVGGRDATRVDGMIMMRAVPTERFGPIVRQSFRPLLKP